MRAWASCERTTAAWQRAGDGREIVEKPAFAAEQRVVLDPQHAPANPGGFQWSQAQVVPRRERINPLARTALGGERHLRRVRAAVVEGANAVSAARGSRPWRRAAIVSGSRTAPPQWAHGQ